MKLLWVAADKPGSRLIRWGLNSDCSHFAVAFDEVSGHDSGIVFHSYGKGTQVVFLQKFLAFYTVLHALEPASPLTLVEEEAAYQSIIKYEADRDYDYPALAWFAWRGVLKKLLGWKIDGVNRWQRSEARLCTGIAPSVLGSLGITLQVPDIEMVPPHDLYHMCCDTGAFRNAHEWLNGVTDG